MSIINWQLFKFAITIASVTTLTKLDQEKQVYFQIADGSYKNGTRIMKNSQGPN